MARKIGSKDKKQRNRRNKVLIGGASGAGILGLGAAAVAGVKRLKSTSATNPVDKDSFVMTGQGNLPALPPARRIPRGTITRGKSEMARKGSKIAATIMNQATASAKEGGMVVARQAGRLAGTAKVMPAYVRQGYNAASATDPAYKFGAKIGRLRGRGKVAEAKVAGKVRSIVKRAKGLLGK